jgi:hypothetical protein
MSLNDDQRKRPLVLVRRDAMLAPKLADVAKLHGSEDSALDFLLGVAGVQCRRTPEPWTKRLLALRAEALGEPESVVDPVMASWQRGAGAMDPFVRDHEVNSPHNVVRLPAAGPAVKITRKSGGEVA